MKFVSYLSFAGICREAFEFYGRVFGGEIAAMITHGETPAGEHVSKDWQDKIINAYCRRPRAHERGFTAEYGRRCQSGFWHINTA